MSVATLFHDCNLFADLGLRGVESVAYCSVSCLGQARLSELFEFLGPRVIAFNGFDSLVGLMVKYVSKMSR